MTLLVRVSCAAIGTLIVGQLIRKNNPEMAAVISLAGVTVMLLAASGMLGSLTQLRDELRNRFGLQESDILPILKCTVAAVVTRLTADLCRESSQTAAASAVELAGSLCSLGMVMPLLLTMLKTIGGLL